MRNPQEYRDRARECIELAQIARPDQALLRQMADSWLKLAEQTDREGRLLQRATLGS